MFGAGLTAAGLADSGQDERNQRERPGDGHA